MPQTRSEKQESVLKHINDLIPNSNELVSKVSTVMANATPELQSVDEVLVESREMHTALTKALKELREFCSQEHRDKFDGTLVQMQGTFASIVTMLMTNVMSCSGQASVNDIPNGGAPNAEVKFANRRDVEKSRGLVSYASV